MCFYCDREARGNPQPWWYVNYVCWTCCIQNGIQHTNNNIDTKNSGRICYRCNQPMIDVGFKFKTPKKNKYKIMERIGKKMGISI